VLLRGENILSKSSVRSAKKRKRNASESQITYLSQNQVEGLANTAFIYALLAIIIFPLGVLFGPLAIAMAKRVLSEKYHSDLATRKARNSRLLGSIGFGIGFLIVILGLIYAIYVLGFLSLKL
jgi:uncharacterized Tic20 family protein